MLFGVLAINKPTGPTSRLVVNRVLRALGTRKIKVGHTGTLDPMASGVLLVAVGRATRLVDESHQCTKSYAGTFELGKRSDTLDAEGEIEILEGCPVPTREEILQATTEFRGNVEQVPPKFSAIRVDGRRAYDLARRGDHFEIPKRSVTISRNEMTGYEYPNFSLDVECSTGTYIRTLGDDIARKCGSEAIMTALVRKRVGSISLDDCCSLDELVDADTVRKRLLDPMRLIPHLPVLTASDEQTLKLMNGAELTLECPQPRAAVVDTRGKLVAVIGHQDGRLRSLNVFRSTNDTAQPNTISTPHSAES